MTEDLIRRNIAANGKEWILSKCAEECAELAAAILKYKNKGESEDAIIAEIADVSLALETLEAIYGRENVERYKAAKVERIEKRVREQEGGK